MRHLIHGTVLLLLLLLGMVVMPASSAQDKAATDKKDDPKADAPKTDAPKPDAPKPEEPKKEHLHKIGPVTGKIVHVDEAKKVLKVSVEIGPNKGALNELQNAQIAVAQARRPQDLVNAQNRLLKAQANLMVNPEKKDIEYPSMDDVKVRMAVPPAAFDDKGNAKKYTQKELDELKGPDKKIPGYPAEFGDLHNGMTVRIDLVSKKDPAKAPRNLKPEDPGADDYKPSAAFILAAETHPGGK